jgi:hypothetical protein
LTPSALLLLGRRVEVTGLQFVDAFGVVAYDAGHVKIYVNAEGVSQIPAQGSYPGTFFKSVANAEGVGNTREP